MMKTQVGIRRYRFAAVAAFSVIFATPVLAQDTTDDLAAAAKRAAPGTQVVDSKGKVVGTLLGGDTVERQVNGGLWVSFGATPSGIAISLTPATFTPGGWTSANCSGVPYMVAAGLPTEAIPVAATTGYSPTATLYFPLLPFQILPIASAMDSGGACININPPVLRLVGRVGAVNLSFVPPFSVK